MSEQAIEEPRAEPPWGAPPGGADWSTLTRSQLKEIRLRGSREDYRRILDALEQNDGITIVDDPA